MTDYRAELQRLVQAYDEHGGKWPDENEQALFQAVEAARTALAQPEPEGPTASDVTELFYRHMGEGSEVGFENAIAEALARWGRPAIKPVPVAERLPEAEDCDGCGNCWWFRPATRDDFPFWWFGGGDNVSTHWLPHHALPLPQP